MTRPKPTGIGPLFEIEEQPYRGTPPHVSAETSVAAAESMREPAKGKRGRVLLEIRVAGDTGATDDELEQTTGWRHQTVSARRRELVLLHYIKDSGRQRKTSSGRNAIVWVAR